MSTLNLQTSLEIDHRTSVNRDPFREPESLESKRVNLFMSMIKDHNNILNLL